MRPMSLRPAPHLAEVAGVELVHHDPVVVLATSVTATAGMLAVLAHATMAGADVTTLFAVLLEPCSSGMRREGMRRMPPRP